MGSVNLSSISRVAKFPTVLNRPINFATFGDSTAVLFDIDKTDCVNTPFPVSGYNNWASGYREKIMHFGDFVAVGNGGISGQTTQQMLNRSIATYAGNRKAIRDVCAQKPDIVLLRCGVNDIATLVTSPYSQPVVDSIIARRVLIISELLREGVVVVDTGIYGYSAAISEELLAVRRRAALSINSYFRSLDLDGYLFADPLDVTCAADGSMIDESISTDGVHLTEKGQYLISKECANKAKTAYKTQLIGVSLNDWKYEYGNPSSNNPAGYSVTIDGTTNAKTCDQFGLKINVTSTAATNDVMLVCPLLAYFTSAGIVAGDMVLIKGRIKSDSLASPVTARVNLYKTDNTIYNIYGSLYNHFDGDMTYSLSFKVPEDFGGNNSYLRFILLDMPVGTYDVEFSETVVYKIPSVG